jgi:hypothetical protein
MSMIINESRNKRLDTIIADLAFQALRNNQLKTQKSIAVNDVICTQKKQIEKLKNKLIYTRLFAGIMLVWAVKLWLA